MRLAACLAAAALAGGCAAHRPAAAPDRPSAVETFIEKVRHESMAARPPRANAAATLEQRDSELGAARALVALEATPAHYRRVAVAYARLGVYDAAYNSFAAAIRLDRRDAAAYDGLARVWRDWGFPHLGLSDAYHATFFAPGSATAHNTLGTLLLNMGQPAGARAEFERALALEPGAAYALNNLCYALLLEGKRAPAIEACRRALQVEPGMPAAHNNLALAYAAAGDVAAARSEFALAGDAATVHYNLGVALMATQQYDAAAAAFDAADALRPYPPRARERARQARSLAQKTVRTPGT